jgi:hypothetical protein
VDYPRLFKEGAQFTVEGYPVSVLSEVYDETHHVLQVLVKVPTSQAEKLRSYLYAGLGSWGWLKANFGPLLSGLAGLTGH